MNAGITTEKELEEILATPRSVLIDFIRQLSSPLVILGAAGKMGPTLTLLAQRAASAAGHRLEIIAASRFSDSAARGWFESRGIQTAQVDLLEPEQIKKLPSSGNVIYLAGMKFGTSKNPALTWAINTLGPAAAVAHYADSRMVALSTGNVYPLVNIQTGGSAEEDDLTPIGEYANAAVARERIFEYCAQKHGTKIALLRLNYAVELRYGVIVDIAKMVWSGTPIHLSNGYFNCIWQGDANEMILRSLELAGNPPSRFNLTGPRVVSVRAIAQELGRLMDREPVFTGVESNTALLSNPKRISAALGDPATPLDPIIQQTASWVRNGGRDLERPTHFQVRSGKF